MRRSVVFETFGIDLIVASVLPFGSALVILLWQAVSWLQAGAWPPVTLLTLGATRPDFEWKGVQKLAVWSLEQPLTLDLFVAGIVIMSIGSAFTSHGAKIAWAESQAAQNKK